jgi:glucan phosphoethanolaminetransferase (alkaline phosphatase superfamily)
MDQPNHSDKATADTNDASHDSHAVHSDKDMLIHVAIKFILLFIIIFSFDFLLDLLLMALDLIFEIIHLLIEFIEEILESILAEALPTNKHENEVIIVNFAMILVLFGLYKLFHGVRFIYRLKRHIKADWLRYKQRKSHDWKLLSLVSKIKLVAAYCTGFSLVFLLAF